MELNREVPRIYQTPDKTNQKGTVGATMELNREVRIYQTPDILTRKAQ